MPFQPAATPSAALDHAPPPMPPPVRLHLAESHARLPLHSVAATRQIEQHHLALVPPHTLMQRAGMAIARTALAIAPHAETIWIACGPGNNGGDGLQAAAVLQAWGKRVVVSLLADPQKMPQDAAAAYQQALHAGIQYVQKPPTSLTRQDLCIDALLGIGGASRQPSEAMCTCIGAMRCSHASILSVDIPTGLDADTGAFAGDGTMDTCVQAAHTLTLLTLKPGLFTAHGRDAAGTIWWDGLGIASTPAALHGCASATAWLYGAWPGSQPPCIRPTHWPHASHKGSFGDACIVGGAAGMAGAAVLAGTAALHGGAGRVYLGMLGPYMPPLLPPELMVRPLATIDALMALPLGKSTTVAGCGGGQAIATFLSTLLQQCPRLVLDADGLNTIASEPALQEMLQQRATHNHITVLTPHPQEAARLLHSSVRHIQANRLEAAQLIANRFQAIVALKGAGTTVAMPDTWHTRDTNLCTLHYAGNARLATAGTGDVLAGCVAAYWEQAHQAAPLPMPDAHTPWQLAWHAACKAVHAHGRAANLWPATTHTQATLTAHALAQALPKFAA